MSLRRTIVLGATLAGLLPLAAARGEPAGHWAAPVGDRYVLLELYQPDRDLNRSDPYLNVLVDTRNGRSWALRYATMPETGERGYVWVEIPFTGGQRAAR